MELFDVGFYLTTPSKIQRIFATLPEEGNMKSFNCNKGFTQNFSVLFIHKVCHLNNLSVKAFVTFVVSNKVQTACRLSLLKINNTYTFAHLEEMVDVFLVFSDHKKG